MTRTALYRHFDAAGQLLYVGISLSAVQRLGQHRDTSGWYGDIASVTIEWLSDRNTALAAEAFAIARENPKHNLQRPHIEGCIQTAYAAPVVLRTAVADAWETNTVCVRGEVPDAVIWQGVQWAVTEYGVEARDGCYHFDAKRVAEKSWSDAKRVSWAEHLVRKGWVNPPDLIRALKVALQVHAGYSVRSLTPSAWITAHVRSGAYDGFYFDQRDADDMTAAFAEEFPGERFVSVGIPECLFGWRAHEGSLRLLFGKEQPWLHQVRDNIHSPRDVRVAA